MTAGGPPLEPETDPMAAVEAWRARHPAVADPVRHRVIEGLARRAAAQHGEARQLMLRRLDQWLAASPAPLAPSAPAPGGGQWALAALAALVDRLGRTATAPPPARCAGAARQPAAPAAAQHLPAAAPPVPLKAVEAFRDTWSRLRAEQRLRQALAQVPARAGPLNSSHLVHAALRAMHELSPAYLDAFMAHVDTLLWLEQASGGGEPAPRAEAGRRPGARAGRKG